MSNTIYALTTYQPLDKITINIEREKICILFVNKHNALQMGYTNLEVRLNIAPLISSPTWVLMQHLRFVCKYQKHSCAMIDSKLLVGVQNRAAAAEDTKVVPQKY